MWMVYLDFHKKKKKKKKTIRQRIYHALCFLQSIMGMAFSFISLVDEITILRQYYTGLLWYLFWQTCAIESSDFTLVMVKQEQYNHNNNLIPWLNDLIIISLVCKRLQHVNWSFPICLCVCVWVGVLSSSALPA